MPDGLSSARSPSRVSVSVADPADMSERLDTSRMAASAPDIDQPPGPAVPVTRTGSSKETRISRSEAASAPVTLGAWPSASACENAVRAPSALPDASATCVSSTLIVPVALAAAVAPLNVIACVAEEVPPESTGAVGVPPDERARDEYAACGAVTGSLYVMVRALPAVITPPVIAGAWPSARDCENAALSPRALPAASAREVWSIVIEPVAFVAAAAPSNVTVWVAEAIPVGPAGVRDPPGESDMDEYAAGTRVTGSLYVMVRALAAVMLADSTRGAMPSDTACEVTLPSALPAASANATVPGA